MCFHHKKTGCLIKYTNTSHLSRIIRNLDDKRMEKPGPQQWRVESRLKHHQTVHTQNHHKLISVVMVSFFGEHVFFQTCCWGFLQPPNSTLRHTHYPLLISISMGGSQAGSAMTMTVYTLTNFPQIIPQGIPFHAEMSHEIKTGRILSIESWLFNIGILLMVYCNAHITGCIIPYIPKTTQVFFIAQI